MRRKYASCLGGGCTMDEDDDFDGGYSRLDPGGAGDSDSIAMDESRHPRHGAGQTEDDYFRAPDSYQWGQADNDQGDPDVADQGTRTYTGVQIETNNDKKKMTKRPIGKRIRHFIRVSLKWIRRGFFTIGPAVTPQIIMNPATVMTHAVGRHINGANKSMVYL